MRTAVVIPTYNNPETILPVALAVHAVHPETMVVDDGSTLLPTDFESTLQANGIRLLRHTVNQGKGAAIITAANALADYDYIITFDADGQHAPKDIPPFLEAINQEGQQGDLILIGVRDFNTPNLPASSRFGRAFSNFWVKLETGSSLQDTQSGFRAYPVSLLRKISYSCTRYGFEIEVLVHLLWGGAQLREIPISVTYPPPEERISHFRPFMDNLRLSLLHTKLCLRRLIPWPHKRLVPRRESSKMPSLFKSPRAFFSTLLHENATPELLGVSAGVSSFLAVLPLFSCHMLVILYVCIRFRLNKVMALAMQNLYMPPFSPFLCIELGFFLRKGTFPTDLSFDTVVAQLHLRLLDWLLGSLILAPLFGVIAGYITYRIARRISKRLP